MPPTSSMSRTDEQESKAWFRYGVRIGYELRGPALDLIALIDRLDSVTPLLDGASRKYAAALRGAAVQVLGVVDALLESVNAHQDPEQHVTHRLQVDFGAHIAEMAHDINGSLGVLMGYAELLALRTESGHPAAHAIAQALIAAINPLSDAVESIREQAPGRQ